MDSRENFKSRWIRHVLVTMLFLVIAFAISSPDVYAATVKSIEVTNLSSNNLTVKKGKTFKAKIEVKGATVKDLTVATSNNKVVTVKNNGKQIEIKGVAKGSANVTIASKDKKVKNVIAVTVGTPVTKVAVATKNANQTVLKGDTINLASMVTITPKSPSNKNLVWSSSDTKVATVTPKGVVKAVGVKNGKATTVTIKAEAQDGSGKYATFKVKVALPVTKITIQGTTTVEKGKMVTLTASTNSDATDQSVIWSLKKSSDSKIVSLRQSGKKVIVTGKSSGTATLVAKAKDGSGVKQECKVTVTASYKISGKVSDANGVAMSGVTVKISDQSTKTNSKGSYSLTVKEGTYSVVATCKGSDGKELKTTISSKKFSANTTQNITMPAYYVTVKFNNDSVTRGDLTSKWKDTSKTTYSYFDDDGDILLLKEKTDYTLTAEGKTDVLKYTATINIKKTDKPKTVTATVTATQPVDLKDSLTIGKEKEITVKEENQYYSFNVTSAGRYYFYTTKDVYCDLVAVNPKDVDGMNDEFDVNDISQAYTKAFYVELEKGVYYLRVASDDTVKNVGIGVTKVRPAVTQNTIKAGEEKSGEVTDEKDLYYEFIPTKTANYYIYLDSERDNTLSLNTIDSVEETLTQDNIDTVEITSVHTEAYCSALLEKNQKYYLAVTGDAGMVTVGVSETRPDYANKVIVADEEESVALNEDTSEMYYKFVPKEDANYYFYMDSDGDEENSDADIFLKVYNPDYDVNTQFTSDASGDANNTDDSGTLDNVGNDSADINENDNTTKDTSEELLDIYWKDVTSSHTKCYVSEKLTKGTTYYFRVEASKSVQVGVTTKQPPITKNSVTEGEELSVLETEGTYYQFTPQQTANYYFYVLGVPASDVTLELKEQNEAYDVNADVEDSKGDSSQGDTGSGDENVLEPLKTVASIEVEDCIYGQCSVSKTLVENKMYYLYVEAGENVQIVITQERPAVTEKELTDTVTTTAGIYQFKPSQSGKYYFYADGFSKDVVIPELTLRIKNPSYNIDASIENSEDSVESSEVSTESIEEWITIDLEDIGISEYELCYESVELEANQIYYVTVDVDIEEPFTVGVTNEKPRLTSQEITMNSPKVVGVSEDVVYYAFYPKTDGIYYFYVNNASVDLSLYVNEIDSAVSEAVEISSDMKCIAYNCKVSDVYYVGVLNDGEIGTLNNVKVGVSAKLPISSKEVSVGETSLAVDKDVYTYYQFTAPENGTYYFYTEGCELSKAQILQYDEEGLSVETVESDDMESALDLECTKDSIYYIGLKGTSEEGAKLIVSDTDLSNSDGNVDTDSDTDLSNSDGNVDTDSDTDLSNSDGNVDTDSDTDLSDSDGNVDTDSDTDLFDLDGGVDADLDIDLSDSDSGLDFDLGEGAD